MAPLMSIHDVSDHLGIPVGTLYQWRTRGKGPKGLRMGRYVRYRPEDVETWIAQQEQT